MVCVEQAADCACARFRTARLDTARRHAAVFTLNYYNYVLSFAYLLNNLRNIGANSLLQLQSFCNHVAYTRDFGKSYDLAVRDISHMAFHVIHKRQMMLAVAENLNILDEYKVV